MVYVLSGTQRLMLTVFEYGPVSLTQALAMCRGRRDAGSVDRDGFNEAAIFLLCRGLLRAQDELLAITITGRAALADV